MKTAILVAIVAIIAVIGWQVITHIGPSPAQPSVQSAPATLEKAPGFSLRDYSGNTVQLSDFAGKLLLINSWASWCPYCQQELPDFATAQKEFGSQVAIIAVNRGEDLSTAKKYSDALGVTKNLVFLLDSTDSFYQSIGGFSMPETIFVNKNG